MDNIEVPEYFICPISLQIMKDPVTAITGITYDRQSIERWLFETNNTTCPVSKQPLPRDSDLTPNNTLCRLIQAWCTLNAANGIDRIPTPKRPLSKLHAINLIRDLYQPDLQIKTLRKLEALAIENDINRVFLVEAGLANALTSFIISCYDKRQMNGLEEALSLFYVVRASLAQSNRPLTENDKIFDSLVWALCGDCLPDSTVVNSNAAYALRVIVEKANPGLLVTLKPEFFKSILCLLRAKSSSISQKGKNSLLHALLDACPWGRNRVVMVESEAVSHLIEVELRSPDQKKATALVLGILCHLCSCADGRAQLVNHTAGIGAVTRPILKVSSTADERAVSIIWLIAKYCGTNRVLEEMLRVGTVAKLCMVMQANSSVHLKEKAKEILRTNSDVWNDYLPSTKADWTFRC
ncbi:E3 ubiquitin-protein ligase PUB24 [Sesamum angolense]|uniref:U-box domain-containing protein n=1 Tax=Sesamum angolense TaxID=2727404 RepID=A0AAE2BT32_9LAMI|nr:E3 ubiquitin-protein ligase PUB24 [Sesamum angolense]